MKPCKSCPFSPQALPGLWSPAHYLLIAYLGSADHVSFIGKTMGCHQWNGVTRPGLSPKDSPACGGWVRAARTTSLALRVAAAYGRIDMADLNDNRTAVLTPAAMLEINGFDMTRIPPLTWSPDDSRYPTYGHWEAALLAIVAEVSDNPEAAGSYVLPGSPLASPISRDAVAATLGEAAAARYFDHDEEDA